MVGNHQKKIFRCPICKIVFSSHGSLRRHKNHKHNTFSFMCNSCPFGCNKRKVMIEHWVTVHDLPAVSLEETLTPKKIISPKKLSCPLCNSCEKNYKDFWKHASTAHAINIQEKNITFNSKEDFEHWKMDIEKETKCKYVCRTKRQLKGNSCTRQYFLCHRSSSKVYKSKAIQQKRSIKGLGTIKTGFTCPAMMLVDWYKRENKKIIVTYQLTHMGHTFDIMRMPLHQDNKDILARKLKDGVPANRILQDIRKSVKPNEGLQRIHLLKRHDLHDIARDYSIGYSTKMHENDAVSVTLLVESLNEMENSPILDYRNELKSKDEFSLIIMTPFQKEILNTFGKVKICIDGTHGLNAYGVQLFTIVVVDEFSNGVPAAFYFSKKCDTAAMVLFFTKVKDALGHSIQTEVFMSDDAAALYDAWVQVMGIPEKRLLCWWHILKNWTINLNAKLQNKSKRRVIKKTLYALATKTETINEFNTCLRNFVAMLMADEDTRMFGQYFVSHYEHRAEAWAFCYRQYIGLNTNMFLESLHKKIEHFCLEGKKCYRLDKTINSLFQLVSDVVFERAIKLASKTPSVKMKNIRTSHRVSVLIKDDDIYNVEPNIWLVTSQSRSNVKYTVEKIKDKCDVTDFCALYCDECCICVHSFKCTCLDNMIYFNICKHIHKVAQSQLKDLSPNMDSIQYRNEIIQNNVEQTQNFLHHQYNNYNGDGNNNDQSQVKFNKCYTSFVNNLKGLVYKFDNISPTSDASVSINIVKKFMDKSIENLNSVLAHVSNTEELEPTEVVNVNKKISPQKIFPKKQNCKNNVELLPSVFAAEQQNLLNLWYADNICVEDVSVINIHTEFDHSY